GFTDPKYFSTCFRKRYDLTPSRFKAKARKAQMENEKISKIKHF
ncbi:MAG: AraC-like DNA-binding protein, partial [Saprospiraceae bacterium]